MHLGWPLLPWEKLNPVRATRITISINTLISVKSFSHTLTLQYAVMRALGFMMVFLVPCRVASQCEKKDTCHYPDTKPLDAPFRDILTKDIFPMTCARVCSLTDGCIGVTLDPLEGKCHLYEESVSFGLTQELTTNLWLYQPVGVPCIRVSKMKIYRLINLVAIDGQSSIRNLFINNVRKNDMFLKLSHSNLLLKHTSSKGTAQWLKVNCHYEPVPSNASIHIEVTFDACILIHSTGHRWSQIKQIWYNF